MVTYWQRSNTNQIAAATGLKPSTVRSQISLLRKSLDFPYTIETKKQDRRPYKSMHRVIKKKLLLRLKDKLCLLYIKMFK
jgi:hypothetical protein